MTQEIKFNNEIQIDVQEPTNVTNNESFIGKKPWTDQLNPKTDGSDKSAWFGQLMSCMELDWGHAKGIYEENDFKNNDMETQIKDLLFTTGIQTSDELIKVLCWLYANRYQEPVFNPEATISNTTLTRKATLSDISWSGGSVTPSNIQSAKTGTLTKGRVTASYNFSQPTATITVSHFTNTPTITSSNTSIVSINGTTIKGMTNGSATITVKDGDDVIKTFNITVNSESITTDVTNNTTFSVSNGSINGTTITAPTVNSNTTINITAKYTYKSVTKTASGVSYTALPTPTVNIPSLISRPKNNKLSRITWSGGSVSPSNINSGSTGTLTKGTVTAYYGNDDGVGTITTNNFVNTPTITSSDTSIVTISGTTITAVREGEATITVTDGDTTITQPITVSNADPTTIVTNDQNTIFSVTSGSINGTTITAPTVTSDTTVTISVTYKGKSSDTTILYTAKPVATYYWYVGTTKPTVVNGTIANAETDVWTNIGTTKPNQIYIESPEDYSFPKWYVAIPTEFNFQPYDMTGSELDLAGWENQQDTTTLAGYTIWTLANNDASFISMFK